MVERLLKTRFIVYLKKPILLGALIFCQILAIFEDFSKMKHIEGDIEKYIETFQTSYQKNAEKHGGKAFLKNRFLKFKPFFYRF